jgi:DNA-binding transcriptional LysR family regulator
MGQMEDINTFVHIVDAGTISRAANQLGIAKSAVSRRLVDLEKRLGVQLLNRTTRQSSLTDAGREYYQRAIQILADVNELNEVTSDSKSELTGGLSVAAPLSFGLQHLTPIINKFAIAHPGIDMRLDFADRQVDLIEEGFDVAIRIAHLKDSSLIARKLTPISLALCASPEYLERNGIPKNPEDLKSHDILQYASAPDNTWRFIDPDGNHISLKLPSRITANNGDYLCGAAVAGLGLSGIPTFMAWKEIEKGNLVRLMTDYSFPNLNAYAVYPQTRHLSKRVRVFIDTLVDAFKAEPYWDKCIENCETDE